MLTIWTYDWVPGGETGARVRDLRLAWACEEAGLDYQVKYTSFENKTPEHFSKQPFGQVPFLEDDGITIFESGACLLHLAKKSEKLMPRDPAGEADTLQWTIAALNSVEVVSVPWMYLSWTDEGPENGLASWLDMRLGHLEGILQGREWFAAGRFTIADILMADIFRTTKRAHQPIYPNIGAYIERACNRPAFKKAYADQTAHFAAANAARAAA
ncbi:MAG TPA: glutathione S-transferase family protein [Sphingomicrobium sp.]